MENIDRKYLRKLRYAFQWGIVALVLWGGWRFYLFWEHFVTGSPTVQRPPLVDGFLPIGALMSLKLWLARGVFDPVHPAALVIFGGALLMSLVLKKSFCGWVCPVGALSEQAFRLGGKMLGGNFRIHKYLDYPLRCVKYLLLAFFFYVVAIRMPPEGIVGFLRTPYWKIADVKMLFFFTEMTKLTMAVLAALFVLSLFFKNFWCRYLCPYGALTGLLSVLSPLKITRNRDACIHCHKCTESCPSLLPVEDKARVRSPECTGCLTCVSRCPAKGALDIAFSKKRAVKPLAFAVLLAAVFFGLIGAAKLTGHWQSNVSYAEYKALVPVASRFEYP